MFPNQGPYNLVPPSPDFARRSDHFRNQSMESLDTVDDPVESYVDLSCYTGEHNEWNHHHEEQESANFDADHEAHILDLTNFDGDIDTTLPGEEVFNRTVKKQGQLRRAKTRKATKATAGAKERLRERLAHTENHQYFAQNRDGRSRIHIPTFSTESAGSSDRLLSYESPLPAGIEQGLSAATEVDLGSPTVAYNEPPWCAIDKQGPPASPNVLRHSHSERHFSNWDSRSDAVSTGEGMRPEIEEQEMRDVDVVSEHARPGKPKLDRIVTDEVENSKGSMIVACESSPLPHILRSSHVQCRLRTHFFKCDGEENHRGEDRTCSYKAWRHAWHDHSCVGRI